jgi:hypothetical protein
VSDLGDPAQLPQPGKVVVDRRPEPPVVCFPLTFLSFSPATRRSDGHRSHAADTISWAHDCHTESSVAAASGSEASSLPDLSQAAGGQRAKEETHLREWWLS